MEGLLSTGPTPSSFFPSFIQIFVHFTSKRTCLQSQHKKSVQPFPTGNPTDQPLPTPSSSKIVPTSIQYTTLLLNSKVCKSQQLQPPQIYPPPLFPIQRAYDQVNPGLGPASLFPLYPARALMVGPYANSSELS